MVVACGVCCPGGTRETLMKGRLSTVGLLVPTNLYQMLFLLKILFAFGTKRATLMRRSTVLSLPIQLVFPAFTYIKPI
jgi:hypothetical protein